MAKSSNNPISESSSVLFVTFSRWANGRRTPTNGSLDPLRDYLVPKIKRLVIIDQPHPGSDRVMPVIEEFDKHNKNPNVNKSSRFLYFLEPLLRKNNVSKTQPIFKIRDFLSIIDWAFRDNTRFDYCICLESINTIAAIMLRKLGRVKKVVYYVSDYSPNRYPSKWFNSLYLYLDRFCVTHADITWDVSKAMQKARIEAGLSPVTSSRVVHVPNGLYPAQIRFSPVAKINKHALIYMGTVGADNGPDIAIKALEIILKKFPDTKLHIIGGTKEDLAWLKKLVQKIKLEDHVVFHGFIESGVEMSKVIRSCMLGLAPYRNIPGSIRLYADAGKIRAYCASGLPVVSSQVPPLGLEVAKRGGALIAKDNAASFAKSIEDIFKDSNLYSELRKNAILFAKYSTWENTFSNAFEQMTKV